MKRAALITLASLALFVGWTSTSQSEWFKGIIYVGSGKIQLTDATGNLVPQGNLTASGNVAIGGTLAVTGATTLRSTLAVTGAQTNSGALNVVGALGVTGAATLRSTLSVAGATTLTDTLAVGGNTTLAGTTTASGAVTFTNPSMVGVGAAVAATGTTKTDATALTKEYNTITGTALQGVSLLTAAVGLHQVVYNNSAVSLIVYPLDAGNDTLAVNDLAALSADVGIAIGPLSTLDCTAFTTTAWHCIYTPGSRSTVAAAGTNQATCTQLASATMGSNVAVTAADATKAVCLPTGGSASTYIPACLTIQSTVNTNTAYLPVFGSASDDDTINGAAADAVYTMGAGARVTFCTIDGVAWLTR